MVSSFFFVEVAFFALILFVEEYSARQLQKSMLNMGVRAMSVSTICSVCVRILIKKGDGKKIRKSYSAQTITQQNKHNN